MKPLSLRAAVILLLLVLMPPSCALRAATDPGLGIAIDKTGTNVILSWFGADGVIYQIESGATLSGISNAAAAFTGNNAVIEFIQPLGLTPAFFRLKRVTIAANFFPATGVLTIIGDQTANRLSVSRNPAGELLVNNGAVPILGGTPTVANTTFIQIFGRDGNDHLSLDESGGPLPSANLAGEGGNDTLVGGSNDDVLNGGPGNDSMHGNDGSDFLSGGDDEDTALGGTGNDTVQLGNGDDRFVWLADHDTDIVDGNDGADVIEIRGTENAEQFTVTANGTRVRFDRLNPAPASVDIGTAEDFVLYAEGGNDSFSATGNLAALIRIAVDGGSGEDTLLGSNGADLIFGGEDDDFVDGQQGNDIALLGSGNDVFQWDPGDGNDHVEGDAGLDTLRFHGSAGSEIIELSGKETALRLTRNLGNISMDCYDIETVRVEALGGTDTLIVNPLEGTDTTNLLFNLASFINGTSGDGQPDTVIVNGTSGADVLTARSSSSEAIATGVGATVTVSGIEPEQDRLALNGAGGDDDLAAPLLFPGVIALTLSGGEDDDMILGSPGNDFLFGDGGDDTIRGGGGEDYALLGEGDDRFVWHPGEGNDIVEGTNGFDTVEINGSNVSELFTATANGTRVRFDRLNPIAFSMDIGTCENLTLHGNEGDDEFAATGNLAALITLTVNGGSGNDTLRGSNGADLIQGGDDNDFIDGQQGADSLHLGAGDDVVQWDPGDGNDVIDGGPGADLLRFNSSNASEVIELSAVGSLLRFTRNVANIVLDASDLELVHHEAGGGVDFIAIHDLSSTAVTNVHINLASLPGGATGDAQVDDVIINGTSGDDAIAISANSNSVVVTGLAARVTISATEQAADRLSINTLAGNDTVNASALPAGHLTLFVDGGADNDLLQGSGGDDSLFGGEGNDVLIGGPGFDTLDGGPGDNVILQ